MNNLITFFLLLLSIAVNAQRVEVITEIDKFENCYNNSIESENRKTFADYGYRGSYTVTDSNNYYLIGNYYIKSGTDTTEFSCYPNLEEDVLKSKLEFNFQPGYLLNSRSIIKKIDSNGELVWGRRVFTDSFRIKTIDISTDRFENSIVFGVGDQIFMRKVDPSGDLLWALNIANSCQTLNERASKWFHVTNEGEIFIAFVERDQESYHDTRYRSNNLYLAKISSSGELLYQHQIARGYYINNERLNLSVRKNEIQLTLVKCSELYLSNGDTLTYSRNTVSLISLNHSGEIKNYNIFQTDNFNLDYLLDIKSDGKGGIYLLNKQRIGYANKKRLVWERNLYRAEGIPNYHQQDYLPEILHIDANLNEVHVNTEDWLRANNTKKQLQSAISILSRRKTKVIIPKTEFSPRIFVCSYLYTSNSILIEWEPCPENICGKTSHFLGKLTLEGN